eukprot:scaffold369_cov177-Ochromonas_danica.AAC.5
MRKLPVDFLAPSRPNRSTESSDAKAVRSDSSSLGAKATSPSEESAAPIDLMSEVSLASTTCIHSSSDSVFWDMQ